MCKTAETGHSCAKWTYGWRADRTIAATPNCPIVTAGESPAHAGSRAGLRSYSACDSCFSRSQLLRAGLTSAAPLALVCNENAGKVKARGAGLVGQFAAEYEP